MVYQELGKKDAWFHNEKSRELQKKNQRLEISTDLFFHSELISNTNLPLHKNDLISRPKRLQGRPLLYKLNDPWIIQPNFNIRQSVHALNKYQIKILISIHFCPRALEVRKLLTICFWLIIVEKFHKAITLHRRKREKIKFLPWNQYSWREKLNCPPFFESQPQSYSFFFLHSGLWWRKSIYSLNIRVFHRYTKFLNTKRINPKKPRLYFFPWSLKWR